MNARKCCIVPWKAFAGSDARKNSHLRVRSFTNWWSCLSVSGTTLIVIEAYGGRQQESELV